MRMEEEVTFCTFAHYFGSLVASPGTLLASAVEIIL